MTRIDRLIADLEAQGIPHDDAVAFARTSATGAAARVCDTIEAAFRTLEEALRPYLQHINGLMRDMGIYDTSDSRRNHYLQRVNRNPPASARRGHRRRW